jgi:hypothetical protein
MYKLTHNNELIVDGILVEILLKKVSTHISAKRRVDIWFQYNEVLYWGVQYGIWSETLHARPIKSKRTMRKILCN